MISYIDEKVKPKIIKKHVCEFKKINKNLEQCIICRKIRKVK